MYLALLIPPVLSCFFDQDSRVRYYACEALYNIAKVSRETILPFFNDIFDGLSKVRIFFSDAKTFSSFSIFTNYSFNSDYSSSRLLELD